MFYLERIEALEKKVDQLETKVKRMDSESHIQIKRYSDGVEHVPVVTLLVDLLRYLGLAVRYDRFDLKFTEYKGKEKQHE